MKINMSTKIISSLNFLALLPPIRLSEEINELKQEFAKKYNSKRALRLPAHITLVPPFRLTEDRSGELFATLEDFCKKFSEMKVSLKDFGAFPPRVIFIEVSNPEEIRPFRDQLLTILRNFLPGEEINKGRAFRPHITLATRDLSRQNFYPAWKEFEHRSFEAHFSVAGLFLFRHNGKTWDNKTEFKFQNEEI